MGMRFHSLLLFSLTIGVANVAPAIAVSDYSTPLGSALETYPYPYPVHFLPLELEVSRRP